MLETVKLDDARVPLHDLDLVAFCRSTPLSAADVALVESERIAAPGRLPAQTVLREPAFSVLLGEVQVDVVEALSIFEQFC